MKVFSHALILGCGRSGQAADQLLRAEGCATRVVAEDRCSTPELEVFLEKERFDICIVSPGFGIEHPWVCAVRERGVPLLSELELGWSRHRGKTVALTGSNGKSTAVKWICESFCAAGLRAEIGGNYGVPACEVVQKHPDLEWLVLEVSSFQLETVQRFQPDIAVLLNLLPNHLDRHGSMEVYERTKARVFGADAHAQTVCVVPVERGDTLKSYAPEAQQWISFGEWATADYRFYEGQIWHDGVAVMRLQDTLFDNPVLGPCTGAAVAAVMAAAEVSLEAAERVAQQFEPLPHRMQKLGEIDGVVYVNDSKATNLAAMAAALQGCRAPVHLIAGGLAKETDFSLVKEILAERTQRIYLVGRASRSMCLAWNRECFCQECGTLEVAFEAAKVAAQPGEVILLSPGCASFDQFSCFEERGACFLELFHAAKQAG